MKKPENLEINPSPGEESQEESIKGAETQEGISSEKYSEVFVQVEEAQEKVKTLNAEVAEILEKKENTKDYLEYFLERIDYLEEEIDEMGSFFEAEHYKEKVRKKYFYESLDHRLDYNARNNLGIIRVNLGIIKKKLEDAIKEIKERQERKEEDEKDLESLDEKMEGEKQKLLERCDEIEKDLSGLIGKLKKKKYDADILEKISNLKKALKEENVSLPQFSDRELSQLLENLRRLNESRDKKKDVISKDQLRLNEFTEKETEKSLEILEEIASDLKKLEEKTNQLFEKSKIEIEWERVFEEELVPELGLTDEDIEKFKERMRESGREVSRLDLKSFGNIKESLRYFLRDRNENHWSVGDTSKFIRQEVQRVKRTMRLSVTRGENGLKGLLHEGKLRCIWELSRDSQLDAAKGMNAQDYLNRRQQIEQNMDVWGENPISATLDSNNHRDELASENQYGKYKIILDGNTIDRSVYTEGDVMNASGMLNYVAKRLSIMSQPNMHNKKLCERRRLLPDHAIIAKAFYNLEYYNGHGDVYFLPKPMGTQVEYIEAMVTGGVTLQDVKEVIVKRVDEVPKEIRDLLEEKGIPLRTEVDSSEETN